MINKKPRRERTFDETVCLQRDSLDLYVDGVLIDHAPINFDGMQRLKDRAGDIMESGILFQIKIRDSVQWESRPTQIDFDPDAYSHESGELRISRQNRQR